MDENQQPSVTQELGRLFPSIRGRGRRGESNELFRVGAESSASATDTNDTSFATRSTTKRTIEEIWGLKATSKKPLKSMSLSNIQRLLRHVCVNVFCVRSSHRRCYVKKVLLEVS